MMNLREPLSGMEVVVTREESADGPLSVRLKRLGASVLNWPMTRTQEPEDPAPLENAILRLESYDWVVFSSARAVDAVTKRRTHPIAGPRIAAIGRPTAAALQSAGWAVDFVPENFSAAALVAAFERNGWAESVRVLFPASSIAHETIPKGLERLGAEVDRVIAYETVPASFDREICQKALARGTVRAIAFTSPSAVRGLIQSIGSDAMNSFLNTAAAVVIGPTTAEAIEKAGHRVGAVAASSTLDGLVEAVVRVLAE